MSEVVEMFVALIVAQLWEFKQLALYSIGDFAISDRFLRGNIAMVGYVKNNGSFGKTKGYLSHSRLL